MIDCTPSHDDAMAIFGALAAPKIKMKAITTVAGNQTSEKATNHAIKVLTKARRLDTRCKGRGKYG